MIYSFLYLFNIEYFNDNDNYLNLLNNKYSDTINNTYLNILNNEYNNNYIYSDTINNNINSNSYFYNNQNIEKCTTNKNNTSDLGEKINSFLKNLLKKEEPLLDIINDNDKNLVDSLDIDKNLNDNNLYQNGSNEDVGELSDNIGSDKDYSPEESINSGSDGEDTFRITPGDSPIPRLEIDRIFDKHVRMNNIWEKMIEKSPNPEEGLKIFNELSLKERHLFLKLVKRVDLDGLSILESISWKLNKLMLLEKIKYFDHDPELVSMIEDARFDRESELNEIAENSTPAELNEHLKKSNLKIFSEKEKMYMLQNNKLSAYTMNQIINKLDPATRDLIRGDPFIIPETDERMNTVTSEQRMKIRLLKNSTTGEISRKSLQELVREARSRNE